MSFDFSIERLATQCILELFKDLTSSEAYCSCLIGEDTAFAPLLPELVRALSQPSISFDEVHQVGEAYLAAMRSRAPKGTKPLRIVDKMLRNAWNLGYVAITLPDACVIHVVRSVLDPHLHIACS